MISKKYIALSFSFFYILFLLMTFRIFYKIYTIQNVDTEKKEKLLKSLQEITYEIEANRGNICADDGSILVTSIPNYELRFDLAAPRVKKNYSQYSDQFAAEVSGFLGMSKSSFKKNLDKAFKKGDRWFKIHSKRLNYNELIEFQELETMSRDKMGSGFIPQSESIRLMPRGDMGSRTLGNLNKGAYGGVHGNIGYSGIEGMMETYLAGEKGIALKANYSGRWISEAKVEPIDGKDIITTINVTLQDFTEDALTRQLQKSQAEWGTAIVMEVATGNIKAISNVGRRKDGTYGETYNYAMGHQGCGEPGSTFKLMSIMAAMEDGSAKLSDMHNVGVGKWEYKGQTIYDSDYGRGGHGNISVKEIFELSSNVGTAMIITKAYEGREKVFIDRLYGFGLNKPLNTGILGEGKPYIKYPTDNTWWGPSLAWISYGYEIKLTPMQVLTFYNAVANNGRMMRPRFVTEVRENGILDREFEPKVINPMICSATTLKNAQEMLRGVCVEGTGKALQKDLPISLAGKTGTAQVAYGAGGYGGKGAKKYQASFAGYFPAEDPKYSMIVVILDPKGSYYGGSVAGPVLKDVASKVYSMLMQPIEHDEENKDTYTQLALNAYKEDASKVTETLKLAEPEKKIDKEDIVNVNIKEGKAIIQDNKLNKTSVPNVKGMTCADAIYILEEQGLKVRITGFGKVVEQSLIAGSPLEKGKIINLKLN